MQSSGSARLSLNTDLKRKRILLFISLKTSLHAWVCGGSALCEHLVVRLVGRQHRQSRKKRNWGHEKEHGALLCPILQADPCKEAEKQRGAAMRTKIA